MRALQSLMISCLLVLSASASLRAQSTRELSVVAGTSEFDASGTGTVPVAAVRMGASLLRRWIFAELSLSYAALDEQFSSTNTRTGVAEAEIQAQVPVGHVRPYIGVGGGVFHYFNNAVGRPSTGPTLSGSAGLRVPFTSTFLLLGEMRLRTWEARRGSGFVNGAAEFTGGIGFVF